ncbi:MAG: histidine--tRNA ligase [Bacteroidota bacterium]
MAKQKTGIPKGTRDFNPDVMMRREFIFEQIKEVFRLHGFLPLETPAMENLSTLTGKYGEEGDRLLFRILNSGDFLNKVPGDISQYDAVSLMPQIAEKGLRYDLTVPFARYVVQHRNELTFPFKRYQVQPVWRADRPQRGRYREFYQCDADVIGSDSLLNELELMGVVDEVFKRLNLCVLIKINNRKILQGIAQWIGVPKRLTEMTIALDKFEKIGKEKVMEELTSRGFSGEALHKFELFLDKAMMDKSVSSLSSILSDSVEGMEGVREIEFLLNAAEKNGVKCQVEFDVTLARGLNYYTGTIFEVKSTEQLFGSICGGGRYDNLTGVFGLEGVSGVGISFGAERIFDIMEAMEKFPEAALESTRIMLINFGKEEAEYCLDILHYLRDNNIASELYPDQAKLKKQMNYANNKNIPFVALIGQDELSSQTVTLRNMFTGKQDQLTKEKLVEVLKG